MPSARRAQQAIEALHKISEAAHAAVDLAQLFPRIHAAVADLMPARNFYVALYERETELLSFPYFVDECDSTPPPRKTRKGLTEYVLTTGKPLLASLEVLAALKDEGKAEVAGTPPVSWLAVPLRAPERTIGVLTVQSYSEAVRYGERDKALLEFVSNQVAAAIERTRAEQALRESEARFRTLADTTPVGILTVEAGRIVYANSAAEAITGWGRVHLLQASVAEYAHPEDRGWVAEWLQAQERSSVPAELEFRITARSGQVRWIYASAGLMLLRRGPALVISLFDVTQRRTAEEEMSRIRHYLKNIIDSMPSVLVGVDRYGRVTEWNQKAEILTGISPESAKGQALGTAFPWLVGQMERVLRAIRIREPQKAEQILHDVGGEKRYADVMIYPLTTEGVEGAVIRVDDVTERVKMEQTMIQAEKIMSVGGIAAGVAHEINNPLGGILQGTQNIFRRFWPELPRNVEAAAECGTDLAAIRAYLEKREILHFLNGIRESGERAARIVTEMLEFSRPSQLRVAPTDLTVCLDRMVALAATDYDLKKRYDFRNIEVVRDYDRELGEVPCIATHIELVALNLLKNAAQAMHSARRYPPDPLRASPCAHAETGTWRASRWRTTARGWTTSRAGACSSRSSRRRTRGSAPGSACPSPTSSWPASTAGRCQ